MLIHFQLFWDCDNLESLDYYQSYFQRLLIGVSILNFFLLKWPLNNNHLSTTATIFGSQDWSLYGATSFSRTHITRTHFSRIFKCSFNPKDNFQKPQFTRIPMFCILPEFFFLGNYFIKYFLSFKKGWLYHQKCVRFYTLLHKNS